jgi:hypothetical protein
MDTYCSQQAIKQLEKRKGGYFYLEIDAGIVNQLERKRSTRIICTLDDRISYRCGLNHLGDGNFFIIIATKYLKKLGKVLGDHVKYSIEKDPDQLGVAIPEVLSVFLSQEDDYKAVFEKLTDGKKRSLIYTITKVKDIDKQVDNIMAFLDKERQKLK